MPVLGDIAATYRAPRRVMRRHLAAGPREDRALAVLMSGCALVFIAQWPRLAREAHLAGDSLGERMGGALMGWLFIAPLLFYALAFVAWLAMRALGARASPFDARMALFWALLAAGPLMLLNGLVAGFVGPGPGEVLVGGLWFAAFVWFWVSGMAAAWRGT